MSFIDAGGVEYIIINPTECKIKSVNHGLPYTNIIIPNIAYDGLTPYNVITIDGNLFDFISPSIIVTVTIPTSVTTIEDYAFTNLINLENVYFDSPSNIQYINDHAFFNCINLESIIIPASILIIDQEAFALCTSLTHITFLDLTNVITSGGFAMNIFSGDPILNTVYYNGSVQDYNYLNNYFTSNYPILNVKIISFQSPFTSCSHTPPNPPNLWSRATLACVDYDYEQLAMRRKAEVLKYKGNQNPLTKKQKWSRIVNGNGPLGKKVWATQNILGSNPNVFNLPQVGNTLILCPTDNNNKNYTLSTTLIGNIDEFGRSVSISGDGNTLAISSVEEQTVYVYTKNINNTWSLTDTISQPTIISFGSSLQLSYDGNTLITGAYLYPLYPIEYGIIYIYEKIASVWTQTFISTGSNNEQRFGKSVSINNNGSVIAVGSQFDNNVNYNGKIEVFERNGSHWNSAPPTGPILIATGLNFEQLSDTGIFLSGNGNFISSTTIVNKIYVYKKNGASWNSGNTSQILTISSDDNVYFDTNANYLCIGTLSGNIAYVYKYNTTISLFEPQQTFNTLDGTSSTVIIISPDGKYVAIGLPNVNSNTGVVYIYKIINNTWNLIQKIYGDRINGLFGISLSFDNDGYTLAIGASSYDAQPGKAYIYFRNGTIITNTIKCEPSSASDVPGNSILCYDPAVPLVNYLPPPRTYLAGGTKWPQSTWKPGDNGFPRGKKGMRMLFQ